MTDDNKGSPFHAGEQSIHERLAIRERMEWVAQRAIRDFMPEQHQTFYAQLPLLFVGAVDAQARPWTTVLTGEPGFIRAPDERTLEIGALPNSHDPIFPALQLDAPLGFLGIELRTRRRNRMNGRVSAVSDKGVSVRVEQTFGNCPKYIQSREWRWRRAAQDQAPRAVDTLHHLDGDARAMIRRADTCFVTSHAPQSGTDVSHRGGCAGFVKIEGSGSLLIPDFLGNYLFMTLGNFVANPRAGLLFIDFETGDLLTLTGATEILWDVQALDGFTGAERGWRFTPTFGIRLRDALPLAWTFRDWSPATLNTGNWTEGVRES